jgi:hypothetical protein
VFSRSQGVAHRRTCRGDQIRGMVRGRSLATTDIQPGLNHILDRPDLTALGSLEGRAARRKAVSFCSAAPLRPPPGSEQRRQIQGESDFAPLRCERLFEEHGPYPPGMISTVFVRSRPRMSVALPTFTDGYVSEWAAGEVAKRIAMRPGWHVVMFPTIPLGVGSPEDFGSRAPFQGSYTVRPSTLRTILMDLGSALGDDGFRWTHRAMANPAHRARAGIQRPPRAPDSGSSGGHDELRLVPSSICQIFTRRNCQIFNRR